MKLAIFTSVSHIQKDNLFYSYAPYIKEMNIWLKHVDEVLLLAPQKKEPINAIHLPYIDKKIIFVIVPEFSFLNVLSLLRSIIVIPKIVWLIFKTMNKADHIHIRCPGNIGLLACLVQIFFPSKKKTTKYAGNWDPKSSQPWSYKLQKWILSNTFFTKNIKVLVYGNWENQSKNIKPFFTATYFEKDKEDAKIRNFKKDIIFLFVGTLSSGKKPLYAIQLVEKINKSNKYCKLQIYGDGVLNSEIKKYIADNQLENCIAVFGNKDEISLKKAYQESHFLVLPSVSEGWPKVVAEAMFWGCFPIVTKISCVPYMLDNENQGAFLTMDFNKDIDTIIGVLGDEKAYLEKTERAFNWSRKYTIELFEKEIKLLLKK